MRIQSGLHGLNSFGFITHIYRCKKLKACAKKFDTNTQTCLFTHIHWFSADNCTIVSMPRAGAALGVSTQKSPVVVMLTSVTKIVLK